MLPVLTSLISLALGVALAAVYVRRDLSAKYRLQQKQESAVLDAAAHQLREPLNEMLGTLDALYVRAEGLSPEVRDLVNTILSSGGRLKTALLDVFDMVDLQSSKLKLYPNAELLPECIHYVEQTCGPIATRKGLELVIDIKSNAQLWLAYDHVRMRQCIASMVRQALRQTDKGRVVVSVQALRDKKKLKAGALVDIDVAVRDSSIGMQKKLAGAYFSPRDYKRNPLLMRGEGGELSLILARMLACAMGGDMWAKSAPGKGVLFRLSVPAKFIKQQSASDASGKRLTAKEAAAEAMRDRTVMIVEDNEVNISVLNAFLKRVEPREILIARNGQEALDLLGEHPCDIVLMDVQMPVMDGVTATRKIRESDQKWSDVPVVAVTAAASANEREACHQAGVTSFLAKPISADALYEKLSRTLSR